MATYTFELPNFTGITAGIQEMTIRINNDPYYENVTLSGITYNSDITEPTLYATFTTQLTPNQISGLNIFQKAIFFGQIAGTNYLFQNIIPSPVRNTLHNNYVPTVISDMYAGYNVGSFVFNNTNNTLYTCLDATPNSATWVQSSWSVVAGPTGATGPNSGMIYYVTPDNGHTGYLAVTNINDANETASIGVTTNQINIGVSGGTLNINAGAINIQGITSQTPQYFLSYNPTNYALSYSQNNFYSTSFSIFLIPSSVNITGSTFMILGGTATSNNLGPVDVSTYGYNFNNTYNNSSGSFTIGSTNYCQCIASLQFQDTSLSTNQQMVLQIVSATSGSTLLAETFNVFNNQTTSNYKLIFNGHIPPDTYQFQISYSNTGSNAILTQINLSCKST